MGALNKRWSELSDKQKNKFGSKSEFRNAKADKADNKKAPSNNQGQSGGKKLSEMILKPSGGGKKGGGRKAGESNALAQSDAGKKSDAVAQATGTASGTAAQNYTGSKKKADVRSKTYSEMGDKYKNNYTKEEHKELRREQNQSAKGKANYKVDNIEDFNLKATGSGSTKSKMQAGEYSVGGNRLSAKDIKQLRKNGGFSREEIVDYANNYVGGSDFKQGAGGFGDKAQALLDRYTNKINRQQNKADATKPEEVTQPAEPIATAPENPMPPAPATPSVPTQPSAPIASNTGDAPIKNSPITIEAPTQTLNPPNNTSSNSGSISSSAPQTNQMDNDQTVIGNTGVVTQNQDNSVRQYGGDTRTFVYNGSSNPATDTPVSAATMGGMYDVNDSPAAQAQRIEFAVQSNKDNQKDYSDTYGIAAAAIKRASENLGTNTQALDNRIQARTQNAFDKSTLLQGQIFGDLFNFKPPTFNRPENPEAPKQPDYEKIFGYN